MDIHHLMTKLILVLSLSNVEISLACIFDPLDVVVMSEMGHFQRQT